MQSWAKLFWACACGVLLAGISMPGATITGPDVPDRRFGCMLCRQEHHYGSSRSAATADKRNICRHCDSMEERATACRTARYRAVTDGRRGSHQAERRRLWRRRVYGLPDEYEVVRNAPFI